MLPGKVGKLTPQTFSSFRHSCLVLPQIVNYLTSETCGFAYILSSRLQNDPLEHRFGVYRQMSGAQYNISVLQILESERRLKLSSILKLFLKETAREMSLKDFIKTFTSEEEPVEITPLEDFLSLLDNSNLLPEVDETIVEARKPGHLPNRGGHLTITLHILWFSSMYNPLANRGNSQTGPLFEDAQVPRFASFYSTLLALVFVAGYDIHSTIAKYKDRCRMLC